ncbi:DUF983 domain-containing protein [Aquimarina sp. TRL1]|uniref:DUF983 domain-containing protein n=1 Tax=Aquimarina sp. (strain TRL1) TaxID=2736252 RepID=UPI0015893050|nr:DUF983 domain-containing protein [Aquimarina sp. TRL1]QKX05503.1 DUF983 domain-containing protein [Aquimarina sp. TRL1]
MARINNILKGKCPKCETGAVFNKQENQFLAIPKMNEKCPNCNHKFEVEPGFFFGAMYVSYGMTVAECIAIYIISSFFISSLLKIFILIVISILLLSFVNYKYSRLLWMYLFTKKVATS